MTTVIVLLVLATLATLLSLRAPHRGLRTLDRDNAADRDALSLAAERSATVDVLLPALRQAR